MSHIYNAILTIGEIVITFLAQIAGILPNGKFKRFVIGHYKLLERIRTEFPTQSTVPTIWIHAASLGEYGVARPIIKQIKQEKECRVVVTFFSSTGYDALKNYHPDVDYIFYLPWDTRKNVRKFLDVIQPQKAIFIISEYWVNYLSELRRRETPTYLISAVIGQQAPFFKWYGCIFKESLKAFTHFMVLNEQSKENLNRLGYTNLTVTGDPLFDNAIAIADTPYCNPVIEKFSKEGDLFIAGSISDKKDMDLVCTLANQHRDVHFIFVPHEISEENLNDLKFNLDGYALLYSECDENTDFSKTQVLIIDFLGALAYLYRYGKWAYVGGGFTPYLHSIIEATVYGLPVAFGPQIHRKVTPNELIRLQIGSIVHSEKELNKWFEALSHNEAELERIKGSAKAYTLQNSGATSLIIRLLYNDER